MDKAVLLSSSPIQNAASPAALSRELVQALQYEIYRAMRLPPANWKRRLLDLALPIPLTRFAQLALQLDREAAVHGFAYASRQTLPAFVEFIEASGTERVPQRGPLIVVGNHPGSLDACIVAALVDRPDLKLIARDMPLLRRLPGIDASMIYSTREVSHRATVLRQALRHLEAGGSLLLFASGNLDPDPACLPGSLDSIDTWTNSAALFLKKVTGARVIVAITSRIIDPRWYRHPLVRLQKSAWDRQFQAEFLQTCMQLLTGKHRISPKVTFSPCCSLYSLTSERTLEGIHQALVERARLQMLAHLL